MKTVLLVFVVALGLNLIWEHLHFRLYDCSAGCNVKTLSFLPLPILVKASIFDAFFVTSLYLGISALHRSLSWLSSWSTLDTILAIIAAFTIATLVERNALATHKWAYAPAMPIVPFFSVGLSPFVQLALLALVTYAIVQQIV